MGQETTSPFEKVYLFSGAFAVSFGEGQSGSRDLLDEVLFVCCILVSIYSSDCNCVRKTQKGMYIAKLFQRVLMNLMATPYYRVFGESTEYYTHILFFISFCSENDVFLKGEGFIRG